ncbi:MAG: SAM-dependent methyltransferase [Nitrososphaeria archaeon]|nr:SAM-dependent methyltransferase [Nitrososphaeria archaeon]
MEIIIENLENELSKWLYYEYENASKITGKNIVFTNVPSGWVKVLSKLGKVVQSHVWEIFDPKDIIILDPQAELRLCYEDMVNKKAVVIGGILGDNPPQGRTSKMLSSYAKGALLRNIGVWQFPIDGAVYVSYMVMNGKKLEDIPVKRGLRIKIKLEKQPYHHYIVLPYAYPIENGRPVISHKLIKYLIKRSLE